MSKVQDADWERWVFANHAAGNTLNDMVKHLLSNTGSKLKDAPSVRRQPNYGSPLMLRKEDIDLVKNEFWGQEMSRRDLNKYVASAITNRNYQAAKQWIDENLFTKDWFTEYRNTNKKGSGRRGMKVFIGMRQPKEDVGVMIAEIPKKRVACLWQCIDVNPTMRPLGRPMSEGCGRWNVISSRRDKITDTNGAKRWMGICKCGRKRSLNQGVVRIMPSKEIALKECEKKNMKMVYGAKIPKKRKTHSNQRVAVVWRCLTRDLRQPDVLCGCGYWNITMMKKVEGQAWCKGCERRTRINPGICYEYNTKEEGQRKIMEMMKNENE